jgi:hypothetical protein
MSPAAGGPTIRRMTSITNVLLDLDTITCLSQSDTGGFGDSEVWLITVPFKVDGDNTFLDDSLQLQHTPGTLFVTQTPGGHGDLGPDADNVSAGDVLPVPPALGRFSTRLRGIPLPAPLDQAFPDGAPGVCGMVYVALEQDFTSDEGATAMAAALLAGVETAVGEVVATLNAANPSVDPDTFDQFEAQLTQAMTDAVAGVQNIFQDLLGGVINPDDSLFSDVVLFSRDDLAPGTNRPFAELYDDGGGNVYRVDGEVSAANECTAALLDVLATGLGRQIDLAPLRAFRDGQIAPRARAGRWLALGNRHTATLAKALGRDAAARSQAVDLLRAVSAAVRSPDKPLPAADVAAAGKLLERVAAVGPRAAQVDLRRLARLVPTLAGMTPNQVVRLLGEHGPEDGVPARPGVIPKPAAAGVSSGR